MQISNRFFHLLKKEPQIRDDAAVMVAGLSSNFETYSGEIKKRAALRGMFRKLNRIDNAIALQKTKNDLFLQSGNPIRFFETLCTAASQTLLPGYRLCCRKNSGSGTAFDVNLFTVAALDLLNQALLFSSNKKVRVSGIQISGGTMFKFGFENSKPNFISQKIKKESIFKTVLHIASLHGGTFALLQKKGGCEMIFSISNKEKDCEKAEIPAVYELICNKTSPLYTGLCDTVDLRKITENNSQNGKVSFKIINRT
jgi:hypothetical protein